MRHALVLHLLLFPVVTQSQPAVKRLGAPVLRSDAIFSSVTSAVRLSDGSVLVADPRERQVVVLDGRSGAARVLGKEGAGPGEYRQPQRLLRLHSGGALLIDPTLRRLSVIDGRGRLGRTFDYPSGIAAFGIEMANSIDSSGVLVFGAPLVGSKPRAVPVYRWRTPDGALDAVDTVRGARLTNTDASGRVRIVPFSGEDGVAVLSDGTLVVARSEERTVEWKTWNGDKVLRTYLISGARTPIPDSIRAKIRPVELEALMPNTYPPFDGEIMVVSSGDRVWLKQLPVSGDSATWLGFARSEREPIRLALPKAATIVGAAEPFLIIATRTENDLKRVEVYRY